MEKVGFFRWLRTHFPFHHGHLNQQDSQFPARGSGRINVMPVAVDSNSLPWEERTIGPISRKVYRKNLYADPGTGMEVRLVRYPAGVINPDHTHPCAHGMYVLEGTLVTHEGRHPPGSFVWFPEGEVMRHGASAESDVTVVFITNKPFEIHYR